MKKLIILVSILLLGTSCSQQSQGVSIAFEELGGEVGYKRGSNNIKYRSSASISGLGQSQIVGSILTVPHKNLSDMYSIPIITGQSKIAEVEYPTEATLADVKKVRNILDILIPLKTVKAVVETEQLILNHLTSKLNQANNQSSEYNSTVDSLKQLYPSFVTASNSKEQVLSELHEKRTYLALENARLDKNISQSILDLKSAKNKNGLVVTNWSKSYESQSKGSFSDYIGFSSNKSRSRGGYLVLAGIKTFSLWLGDDFACYLAKRKKRLTGSDSILSDYGYIVTFSIMAKYRAYSESLDYKKALSARLNIRIEELANLVGSNYKEYLKKQSIDLSRTIGNIVSSTNSGIISNPNKKPLYEFKYVNDSNFSASMVEQYKRSDNYLPVYAVRNSISSVGVVAPTGKIYKGRCEY